MSCRAWRREAGGRQDAHRHLARTVVTYLHDVVINLCCPKDFVQLSCPVKMPVEVVPQVRIRMPASQTSLQRWQFDGQAHDREWYTQRSLIPRTSLLLRDHSGHA